MKNTDTYNVIKELREDLSVARKLIAIAAWLGFALGIFSGIYVI